MPYVFYGNSVRIAVIFSWTKTKIQQVLGIFN